MKTAVIPNAALLFPPLKMRRNVDIQAHYVEHKLCHCPDIMGLTNFRCDGDRRGGPALSLVFRWMV